MRTSENSFGSGCIQFCMISMISVGLTYARRNSGVQLYCEIAFVSSQREEGGCAKYLGKETMRKFDSDASLEANTAGARGIRSSLS